MVEEAGASEPTRRAIRLKWWQRVVLGVGGTAMTGFAGWMVFLPGEDGAAVAAFVAAGFVSGLLAIVGRVPTQLKVGDSEAQFYEDQLDVLASEMNQTQLETSASQLAITGGSEAASRIEEHLSFEAAMTEVVTSAARSLSGSTVYEVSGDRFRADLLVEFENGRRIAIDIKLNANIPSLHTLLVASQSNQIDILVITRELPRSLRRATKTLEGLSRGRRCFVAEPDFEIVRYLLKVLRGDVVTSPPNHKYFEIKQGQVR